MLFGKKCKNEIEEKNKMIDFILPLYLNQRFVYDILAIKNDGFTEFFEIKDTKDNKDEHNSNVKATLGKNNDFALIQASMNGEIKEKSFTGDNNEKSYKKTHTPTSLFMQVYQFLKESKQIKKLERIDDINDVKSGDFVEIESNIELNTIVEFFETFDKVIDITDAFSRFATADNKKTIKNSQFASIKKCIENTMDALGNKENNVKYGVCKLDEKDIVIKLNRDYFINSDYSEIKNGKFRIIGKVLEIIPEGEKILLNRENAVGLYDPSTFQPVKELLTTMDNINIKEFKDIVEGKTIVILPIAIGI